MLLEELSCQSRVGVVLPSLSLFPVQHEPGSLAHLSYLLVIFGSSSWISRRPEGFAGYNFWAGAVKSFHPLMALQDKGWEGFSSWQPFFAGVDHPSPSLTSLSCFWPFLCSEMAERWCPDQKSWSCQALGFWKARDFSRGVGLRKTKEILSYSTVDASRTSLRMLPALLSFCSLPNDFNSWTLLPFALSSFQLQGR